jgi:Nuclease-related domain
MDARPSYGWQALSGVGWTVVVLSAVYLGLATVEAALVPGYWINVPGIAAICAAVGLGAWFFIRFARRPRRAGRRSRRNAYEARLKFIRKRRTSLVVFLLVYFGLGVFVLYALPWPSFSFRMGCLVIGLPWLVSWVLSMDNAEGLRMGALAEEWTSERLRTLRKIGWQVIDRVEFEHMDVDHVAVSTHGVIAVETKWSSYDKKFQGQQMAKLLDQAREGARKIWLLLKSHDINVDVRPMLVLWGTRN